MPLNPAAQMISSRLTRVWRWRGGSFRNSEAFSPVSDRRLSIERQVPIPQFSKGIAPLERRRTPPPPPPPPLSHQCHYPFIEEPQAFWSDVGIFLAKGKSAT